MTQTTSSGSSFVNIGERTNVTGSAKFKKLILSGDYEAAVEVAALSHSIHGAIGFTAEFDLQLYTRRLHLWRQVGGSESHWHAVLGAALVDQHDGLALDLLREIALAST